MDQVEASEKGFSYLIHIDNQKVYFIIEENHL